MPQLEQRFSALGSSLIVGLAWGLWHVPLFFVPGIALAGGETILTAPAQAVWSVSGTTGMAIIFTWVYNNTHGSLLLAVLLHASLNATPNALVPLLYPDVSGEVAVLIGRVEVGLIWVVAIGLVAVFGPRHLSRNAPTWLGESRRVVYPDQ